MMRMTKIKEGRRKRGEEHLKNGVGGKISHAEDDKDKGREEEKSGKNTSRMVLVGRSAMMRMTKIKEGRRKRVGRTPQEWCWWEDQPC